MRLRRHAGLGTGVLWSCLVLASGPGVETARGEEPKNSPWQIELSSGIRTITLPTFDAPVGDTLVAGFPGLISETFRLSMPGGEGRVIYTSRGGWEFEVGGQHWSGRGKTSAQPHFTGGYGLAVTGLDGTSGILVGAGELDGDSVHAFVEASLTEAHLRIARWVRTEGLQLRPFAGLIYERFAQDYGASFRLKEPAINDFELPYELSQQVENIRFGGEIGLQSIMPLGESWRLHSGVAYALYHQRTRLTASDCAASAMLSSGFDCEDTTAFQYQRLLDGSATDEKDRIVSRVKLEAGLSYALSFGRLGFNAFAQYNTAVAGVKNPLLTEDPFLGVDATRPPPAHLTFEDAWSYGATLSLTIPLR